MESTGLSEEEWKSINVLLNCGSPVKRNLEEIWPHLPNLEWLHSTAAGVEHILFPALIDGPVTLTNAKAGLSGALQDPAFHSCDGDCRDVKTKLW